VCRRNRCQEGLGACVFGVQGNEGHSPNACRDPVRGDSVNPRIVETEADRRTALRLEYARDEEQLRKLERRGGVYPVVTNLDDKEKYAADQIFVRTRWKYHVERPMRYLKSRLRVRPVSFRKEERVRGLALITFLALTAYCLPEHEAKKHDPKMTSHQVLKKFNPILFTTGMMLDGKRFATVENVRDEHINFIRMLGLARGSYRTLAADTTPAVGWRGGVL